MHLIDSGDDKRSAAEGEIVAYVSFAWATKSLRQIGHLVFVVCFHTSAALRFAPPLSRLLRA